MHIGGRQVPAAGGAWFETVDPFTGEVWAEVARGDRRDVEPPSRPPHAAFQGGPWPELTATARGLLLHRLGDLVLEHLEELVAAESRDNGKSYTELRAALRTMAGWYHYYGGLADKIQGEVIPVDRPAVAQLHAARAVRRGGRDPPVELAAAAGLVEARAGARRRQHGRRQALGAHLDVDRHVAWTARARRRHPGRRRSTS